MFAAARVMAAGKAGLESLPYFVDELLAQGITQLAPWAADHSVEQIDALENMVRERRAGDWSKIFQIGISDTKIGITLHPDTGPSKRLLSRVNPAATDSTQLADHPALLAAWSRINIWEYCRDTANLWREFKYQQGVADGQQLAIVIPYCPEGPTSGTIGMYLGAALRKHFDSERLGEELVIWGIELCPPVNEDGAGKLNALSLRNVFRGFVARDELLKGLPLNVDAEDTTTNPPFDITIAFDGGTASVPSGDINEIHPALDRAAAQATACLLNGAAGGDVAEGTDWLNKGKRWNAHLVHVVSQHSYERGCRYLNYQVRLPWERSRAEWDAASIARKKEAFLHQVDTQISPMLKEEKDLQVKEKIGDLVELAEKVRATRWDKSVVKTFTRNHKTVEGYLNQAIETSDHWCREYNQYSPSTVTYRVDPFCVNIALTPGLRRRMAEQIRDEGKPQPIADLLGNGNINVRDRMQALFSRVLERQDAVDSGAFFEQIIAISIDNPVNGIGSNPLAGAGNRAFRPAREILGDFIAHPEQGSDGTFNFLTHDLYRHQQGVEGENNDASPPLGTLGWQLKNIEFDVPVEYTFLTLARCREQDGFKDVSTYKRLEAAHRDGTRDLNNLRFYAHYYGVKPPGALTDPVAESPAEAAPSPNGAVEAVPATVTNGHHTEVGFAEQQA